MQRDNPFLLDLLTVALDPENKFHTFNANRHSEMFLVHTANGGETTQPVWGELTEMFAYPLDEQRSPRGWLADLLNRFRNILTLTSSLRRCNNYTISGLDNLEVLSACSRDLRKVLLHRAVMCQ